MQPELHLKLQPGQKVQGTGVSLPGGAPATVRPQLKQGGSQKTPPTSPLPLLPGLFREGINQSRGIGVGILHSLTCFTCRSTTVWKTCATSKEMLAMSSVMARTPTVTRHKDFMAAPGNGLGRHRRCQRRAPAGRRGRAAAELRPPAREEPPRRAACPRLRRERPSARGRGTARPGRAWDPEPNAPRWALCPAYREREKRPKIMSGFEFLSPRARPSLPGCRGWNCRSALPLQQARS